MPITAYLIDDEQIAIDNLLSYIGRIPEIVVAGYTTNPLKGFEEIKQRKPQLIFCDIDMPDITGFELIAELKKLKEWECLIIISSGHREYGVEGFMLEVFDFLLKPTGFSRFWQVIERAKKVLTATNEEPGLLPPALSEYITIIPVGEGERKQERIRLGDIVYIESQKNNIAIYRNQYAPVITRSSLKAILEILPPDCFLQVHQSYIAGLYYVMHYKYDVVMLKGNHQIKIGSSFRENALTILKRIIH
jgi:two-component system, LytTR family, response regulator